MCFDQIINIGRNLCWETIRLRQPDSCHEVSLAFLTGPDDYASAEIAGAQAGPSNASILRRPGFNPTATSGAMLQQQQPQQQPAYNFPPAPPSASQGAPGMPNMTFPPPQPQVTMSTGVSGAPATFTNLNSMSTAVQSSQIKSEQSAAADMSAQSILSDLAEGGSTCNSMQIDSGLLNYITDNFNADSLDQNDSLTKFLNQEMNGAADNAAELPLGDQLDVLHQQLNNLDQ